MSEDVELPAGVVHLRCANPGPMTLSGTNTYVVSLDLHADPAGSDEKLGGPGGHSDIGSPCAGVAIIDPGPELTVSDPDERMEPRGRASHHERIVRAVQSLTRSRKVVILLTHHHDDHVGGVEKLVERLTAAGMTTTVHGAGRGTFPDDLQPLRVVPAPGHTQDSVCFFLESGSTRVLFSGDTLLGGSSSFVAYPDGNLTAYLETLENLQHRLRHVGGAMLAPGHGRIGDDAGSVVQGYREHRLERLAQVSEVLDAVGPTASVDDVIAEVYSDIAADLRPAVEAVVQAQVEHLRR